MIYSMTGYGKAVVAYKEKKINVEVKSLNSKALDLSTRIAPLYREKEMELRQIIAKEVIRGKVDFALWIEKDAGADATPINEALIQNYYKQIKDIMANEQLPEPNDWWATLLRLPDVTARIDVEFAEKIDNIESLLAQIEPFEKERVEKIRARIVDGLKSIPDVEYDNNRLEQELIYYIEKLDISEEKQRLTNHLRYFRETMDEEAGQGKKLGFITQEMGREINTTGSKSNNAEMQNIVVKMKDELEQIKEQILNAL